VSEQSTSWGSLRLRVELHRKISRLAIPLFSTLQDETGPALQLHRQLTLTGSIRSCATKFWSLRQTCVTDSVSVGSKGDGAGTHNPPALQNRCRVPSQLRRSLKVPRIVSSLLFSMLQEPLLLYILHIALLQIPPREKGCQDVFFFQVYLRILTRQNSRQARTRQIGQI
jgi:hypothetical protein